MDHQKSFSTENENAPRDETIRFLFCPRAWRQFLVRNFWPEHGWPALFTFALLSLLLLPVYLAGELFFHENGSRQEVASSTLRNISLFSAHSPGQISPALKKIPLFVDPSLHPEEATSCRHDQGSAPHHLGAALECHHESGLLPGSGSGSLDMNKEEGPSVSLPVGSTCAFRPISMPLSILPSPIAPPPWE